MEKAPWWEKKLVEFLEFNGWTYEYPGFAQLEYRAGERGVEKGSRVHFPERKDCILIIGTVNGYPELTENHIDMYETGDNQPVRCWECRDGGNYSFDVIREAYGIDTAVQIDVAIKLFEAGLREPRKKAV